MRKSDFSTEILYIVPKVDVTQLAAGGEPSTRFPPEGLVETADITQRPRHALMRVRNHDCASNFAVTDVHKRVRFHGCRWCSIGAGEAPSEQRIQFKRLK